MLKIAGIRWKDFKTRLVNQFIKNTHPNYESLIQLHDFLTEEQWEKFKKKRESQDFKEISEKARESQSHNEHPHYLGPSGYAGKRAGWLVSNPLQIPASSTQLDGSSIISSDDRSLDWVRVRSKKRTDGTYYIPNENNREVYEKVIEAREEMSQGTFVPRRHHDALLHALGKGEHLGHLKGCGGYVMIRDVYGKSSKTEKASSGVFSVDELRQLLTKEVEASVAKQVREETRMEMQNQIDVMRERYDSILKSMGAQLPNDMEVDMNPSHYPPTRSSCHSVDPDPFANFENLAPCRLAISCDPIMIVATRMVYPTYFESVVHHQKIMVYPIMVNHVKVSVDDILPGAKMSLLLMPSQHHTMDWLNISIIQIWKKFLYDLCVNSEANSIGFMCSGLLALAKKDLDATVNYIKASLIRLASKKYILAPYIQGQHWILLVIDCENNKVFIMDSSKSKWTLDVKPALGMKN